MQAAKVAKLEQEFRMAIRKALGMGFQIKRGRTLVKDGPRQECCALGAGVVARKGPSLMQSLYVNIGVDSASSALGLPLHEACAIAEGFDAICTPRTALQRMGARLWAYAQRCKPLMP